MKTTTPRFLAAMILAIAVTLTPSYALFDFLKKDKNAPAPAGAVLDEQEAAARELYEKALSKENAGKSDSARDLYRDIVEKYPLTTVAAQSQFKVGELYEKEGKEQKAFEGYQEFIDGYKNSPLFMVAVKRQYNIATRGLTTKTSSVMGLKFKMQSTELIKMFGQIKANAPYSEYAPKAQFQIGEIHARQKQWGEAVAAYQEVVADYPDNPQAAEAQFRIGTLLTEVSEKGNNDQAHNRKTQEAYEEYLIQFPDSDRAADAELQLDELKSREVTKSFEIGEFYEKKGNLKAAAVYYREVLKHPSASEYEAARTRLDDIGPEGDINAELTLNTDRFETVKADHNTKSRPDYLGPPAPKIAKTKPRAMRTSMDDFSPVPIVEPDLPESEPSDEPRPPLQPLLPLPSAVNGFSSTPTVVAGPEIPIPGSEEPETPEISINKETDAAASDESAKEAE